MNKILQIIDDFLTDIYGVSIISESIPPEFERITELRNVYQTVKKIIQEHTKPTPTEFIRFIYPVLEVAIQWKQLRDERNAKFDEYIKKNKSRFKTRPNYLGTAFEIDMVSRALLSEWDIDFVENTSNTGRQIDFIFYRNNQDGSTAGVECHSKRPSCKTLTINQINEVIEDKAQQLDALTRPVNEKILIIDITMDNYSRPVILNDFDKIGKPHTINGILLTWREDKINGENHSLKIEERTFGDMSNRGFSTTFTAEIRSNCCFFRKDTKNPPKWGECGPKEKLI